MNSLTQQFKFGRSFSLVGMSIGSSLAAEDAEIGDIVSSSELIGGVYQMDYDTCTVLSNDRWKDDAGGVPRHSFLLATATSWEDSEAFDPEDAYAILLRSKGPDQLPNQRELLETRMEAMRKEVTGDSDEDLDRDQLAPGPSEDILDPYTRNEIQFSGIETEILGTIYEDDGEVKFGSDVETFYSSARYRVYKPQADALANIFRLLQIGEDTDTDSVIDLGRVRYTSTERQSNLDDATVPMDIEDAIGNKTALFGMTRTGKSNTMKILATATFRRAIRDDREIGQLFFDPQGEYANVNIQDDETALAELPDDVVTVYSWNADGDQESLGIDFFDYDLISDVWGLTRLLLTRDADYVDNFKTANVVGPEDQDDNYSEYTRALRARAAFYACLIRAGFDIEDSEEIPVPTNQGVRDFVNDNTSSEYNYTTTDAVGNGWVFMNSDELTTFFDTVRNNQDSNDDLDDFVHTDLDYILKLFNREVGNGYEILSTLQRYHDPGREGYYPRQIYDSLADGDIVIVDQTNATDEVNQRISKTIVEYIVNEQARLFNNREDPHDIQIYVEEAHRLFGSEYLDDADENDPYRRLAKEAGKFNIGLMYATQEVSDVDGGVLSNTANFIVTHLNNTDETRELSKYYDFETFEDHIRKVEDTGFARVLTLSGDFVVPTQIREFDSSVIDEVSDEYEEQSSAEDLSEFTGEE